MPSPAGSRLQTHEYDSLVACNGERVWEAYAQNKTPGTYRMFFHYGPEVGFGKRRVPLLTIIAITPHLKAKLEMRRSKL